jgi:hypothetical protein
MVYARPADTPTTTLVIASPNAAKSSVVPRSRLDGPSWAHLLVGGLRMPLAGVSKDDLSGSERGLHVRANLAMSESPQSRGTRCLRFSFLRRSFVTIHAIIMPICIDTPTPLRTRRGLGLPRWTEEKLGGPCWRRLLHPGHVAAKVAAVVSQVTHWQRYCAKVALAHLCALIIFFFQLETILFGDESTNKRGTPNLLNRHTILSSLE